MTVTAEAAPATAPGRTSESGCSRVRQARASPLAMSTEPAR